MTTFDRLATSIACAYNHLGQSSFGPPQVIETPKDGPTLGGCRFRMYYGSELTASAMRKWLNRVAVQTLFIEPGSSWESGYNESFNGKLRDELLDRDNFYSLKDAQVIVERRRQEYNRIRPHSSLGYRPPAARGGAAQENSQPSEQPEVSFA